MGIRGSKDLLPKPPGRGVTGARQAAFAAIRNPVEAKLDPQNFLTAKSKKSKKVSFKSLEN
jgi:hypothetical protein